MQENARQGFWNGSHTPFGYQAVAAERRGTKVKKVLAIDEAEASVVRQIYDLSLGAAGMPLGVKAIVNHLNAHGTRLRGKPFQISSVHRILTAKTYSGVLQFNRRSARTGRLKDADDWIEISVPSIITSDTFDQVQSSLRKPDAAHRHRPLRDLRFRHDTAHRQERPVSLLHLLDQGAPGRHRLQGPHGADGKARHARR